MVSHVAKKGPTKANHGDSSLVARNSAVSRTGVLPVRRSSSSGSTSSRSSSSSASSSPRSAFPSRVVPESRAAAIPANAARNRVSPVGVPGSGEEVILFQTYFKSIGPRTYAAQVKRAANGNHALVITEGKRDSKTNQVIKHKTYVWSEDFTAFFSMLQETVQWIREHPVPADVQRKRNQFWSRQKKVAS